jgi:protein involved in polysaccharide export with SLBB domain
MHFILCFFTLGLTCISSLRAAPRIEEQDFLFIKLEGVPADLAKEFETTYLVNNGAVTVPLIGNVPAQGLDSAELGWVIAKRLRDGRFFNQPKVSVSIRSECSFCLQRAIIVGGPVHDPGRHPWVKGMTLTQALAVASGVETGAEDKVRIKRRNGQIQEFSRKALRKDPSLDPKLLPGDFIEVSGEF